MKNIVFIPLDERPCNYYFPQIMPFAGLHVTMPPLEMLGLKKRPANREALIDWLKTRAKDADAFVIAMDTLIYGGLIPSRLHEEQSETLCAFADSVKELKEISQAKIYAFQTVMRCPWYSLSDEEPDYYAEYGSDIHLYGRYEHKRRLGVADEKESAELSDLRKKIPENVLNDFVGRRETNLGVLRHTLDLFEAGYIDKLIIPQDDSAPYGFTSMDREKVVGEIKRRGLQIDVPIYPAADDTGLTMYAAAVNSRCGKTPAVYVYYAASNGAFVVPAFEDRTLDATVKNQIRAAGCRRTYSFEDCDIFLAVNVGSAMPYRPTESQKVIPYDIERSLPEYIEQIEYALRKGKIVAVADVAYPTGADTELTELLYRRGLLLKIHAYAGWNTSSNTIGTALCQACLFSAGGDRNGNERFLIHRYYDDIGYCTHTRTFIDETAVPEHGCTVFRLDGERGECVAAAKKELLRYMAETYPEIAGKVEDISVSSPWNRTFEMNFEITFKEKN